MEHIIENQKIKNIKVVKNLGHICWKEIIHELLKKDIRAERKANGSRWRYLTIKIKED